MKDLKIGTKFFIGLLGLQAIIELGFGGAILFNFPTMLDAAFGITYSSELDILGIALGLYLLLLTALMVLSAYWTIKRNTSGPILGIIVGVFLITFGVTSFLMLGQIDGLFGDSLRGVITAVLGYMAYKELK
jgi:hypothetical protein